jgi:hypothetical protein
MQLRILKKKKKKKLLPNHTVVRTTRNLTLIVAEKAYYL